MKHRRYALDSAHSCRKVTLPEMLAEALRNEARFDYHWSSAIKVVMRVATCLGISMLAALIYVWSKSTYLSWQSPMLLTGMLLLFIGLYSSEVYSDRKHKQGRQIARLRNHPVAVGPTLMLMHNEQDSEVLTAATQFLKTHLPMLQELHYASITSRQRLSLNQLVNSSDEELALIAVGALQNVGDESSIGHLQSMLAIGSPSRKMRIALEASLRTIRARVAIRKQAATLLRAGGTDSRADTLLLRSSVRNMDIESGQLLRSTD